MSAITVYHNPRCSKSRATLALLEQHQITPEVVRYLDQPPTRDTLRGLVGRLGIPVRQLLRTGEAPYQQLQLASVEDDEALLAAMVQYPILIERPIVDDGTRAVLGRPPENVLALL